ncbi:unnamed protein product [Ambrosiozyma monospora]|uniref:Unnamed protein product n=1 Tax=Ambrosiozyma monospora TaxID=43982 RepID=A0ACB5SZX2_AMBMO|nr:unnamed protein product [Ambrosiozyma monospora]
MSAENAQYLAELTDKLASAYKFKTGKKMQRRRYKPLKQLLNDDLKRTQQKQSESPTPLPNLISYHTLNAPPSLKPIRTYCDITGLPTNYKSPHNQLRYYDKECYAIVKNMAPGVDQQYLALRGANVVLK